jgi:crotonobetainyl-CoA:carnitine CoA-transferase CaiB-like acyl-CoA transferase
MENKPLQDIVVVDFSQFLSGPSAGLRLADMGAKVIKVEKPGTGDICRYLYVSDVKIEGESTIFHAINRNKKSYSADLKSEADKEKIEKILAQADVMLHNFRPGVMERLGFDYESVKRINPQIVYAEISGYGNEGPWVDLPGQDLLLQSVSGLAWLSSKDGKHPVPMGVAVVDILAGTYIAQGILAALFRKSVSGQGELVQVSMLEAAIDFQSEMLTEFYNRPQSAVAPVKSDVINGIFETASGFINILGDDGKKLSEILMKELGLVIAKSVRQEFIAKLLLRRTAKEWVEALQKEGIHCVQVMDYDMLRKEPAYQSLAMELKVKTSNGLTITTTRCPIRMDGMLFTSDIGAPLLGEHTQEIDQIFCITKESEAA